VSPATARRRKGRMVAVALMAKIEIFLKNNKINISKKKTF
jgi:hypothetical protein